MNKEAELKKEIEALEKNIEINLQLQKMLLNDLQKVSKEIK